ETGRIAGLPGGMDYLAGFGPAPAGVVDTPEWTNVINKRLGGAATPLNSFVNALMRWGNPSSNSMAINMFNNRHQTALTPQQLQVPATPPPSVVPQGPAAGGAGAGAMGGAPGMPGMPATNATIGMPQTPWTPGWGLPGLVY